MFNWKEVKDLRFDGQWYVFTDKDGKQARLDKEAMIICVAGYKLSNEGGI